MTIRDELAAHNERVKMRAQTINAIGLGVIGFGLLRPLTGDPVTITWGAVLWTGMGLAFHAYALYILGEMRQRKPADEL